MNESCIYRVGWCFLCLWKFQKQFLFSLWTNALAVCDNAWIRCIIFHHAHLVIFVLSSLRDTKPQPCKWLWHTEPKQWNPCHVKCKVSGTEKNHSTKYGMFMASNDGEQVVLGKVCENFNLLGTACMKALKWLHFVSFSSVSRLINLHFWLVLSWKNHYNRVRPRGKLMTGIFKYHIQKILSQSTAALISQGPWASEGFFQGEQ